MFKARLSTLRQRLEELDIAAAFVTDEDNVYYLSGYHDYLHMDFGRPTILVVARDAPCRLITPAMELEMAERMAAVPIIEPWQDGEDDEWRGPLQKAVERTGAGRIAIEPGRMPPPVRAVIDAAAGPDRLADITPALAAMRMIKSAPEVQLARHAGAVAEAMMAAAHDTIGEGVCEYEVALATSAAGTRKAAELLAAHYSDRSMSPNTHFLQIMASGKDITMPHHRATLKRMKRGDPVFVCFCGMTNFHRFKLGFDRTFWIGDIAERAQAKIYQVALDSQAAALAMVRPGVTAEAVHAAYAEVIQGAGFDYPFRCGRATGFSYLEAPQLVFGDTTVLAPGMVLAVDGSASEAKSFRAQVGDSVVVTEDGYELLTHFPKRLDEVILA